MVASEDDFPAPVKARPAYGSIQVLTPPNGTSGQDTAILNHLGAHIPAGKAALVLYVKWQAQSTDLSSREVELQMRDLNLGGNRLNVAEHTIPANTSRTYIVMPGGNNYETSTRVYRGAPTPFLVPSVKSLVLEGEANVTHTAIEIHYMVVDAR